jgi:hypothetical protein
VFVFVFSDSFGYMMERQQTAVAVEGSTSGRILDVATNFITAIPQAPIFGYGLGVGTNAGGYATTGARTFTLAEYELPRIILELGPIFGFLIVFIRLFLCAYLFTRSVKSLRRTGDASSIIFCSFAIPLMSFGSATGSNPMVTLTWFAAGIAFAFARVPAIAKRKHPVFAPNLPQTPHWRAQA